jgi:hypothetical protein
MSTYKKNSIESDGPEVAALASRAAPNYLVGVEQMASNNEVPRLTVNDLEQMTTHDLAQLLSNLVLVLRRLPNVPLQDLTPLEEHYDVTGLAAGLRHDAETNAASKKDLPDWTVG